MKFGESCALLYIEKSVVDGVKVYIQPTFRFKNCLPLPLSLEYTAHPSNQPRSVILKPQQLLTADMDLSKEVRGKI